MTSSQGVASYYFRSRDPETADVKRICSCCRYYRDPCTNQRATRKKSFEACELPFEKRATGHVMQRRRWWSLGGVWSVTGWTVLVVLLAVTCQSVTSADSAQQQQPAVIRQGTCRAIVNHSLIDLSRLNPANGSVRYSISTPSLVIRTPSNTGWPKTWHTIFVYTPVVICILPLFIFDDREIVEKTFQEVTTGEFQFQCCYGKCYVYLVVICWSIFIDSRTIFVKL